MQQQMWNRKFEGEQYLYGKAPNTFLKAYIDTFEPQQHLLFLGEGEGRNACYAASKGHDVVAIDASDVGIEKANALANELGCQINTIHSDLEHWQPLKKYDQVMCSFLHLLSPLREQVFTRAIDALQLGGHFIAEFFSIDQLNFTSGGPKDAALLYELSSLRAIFTHRDVVIEQLESVERELDEGRGHQGMGSVIQICVKKIKE